MTGSCQVATSSFLYRRSVHDEIGYYNEAALFTTYWEFYLRFLLKYEIGVIQEKLVGLEKICLRKEKTYYQKQIKELRTILKKENLELASLIEIKNCLSCHSMRDMLRADLKSAFKAIKRIQKI